MPSRLITAVRRYILDRIVLRPTRNPLDHRPQEHQSWTCNGLTLESFVHRGDPRSPTEMLVIKFPGTSGRAERASRFPADILNVLGTHVNADVWSLNAPGYGNSSGRASLDRMAETSTEFWHRTIRLYPNIQRVWICGNSLGCATALHVAAQLQQQGRVAAVPPTGLVLRNPPPLVSVVKRIARRYPGGQLMHRVAESLNDSMNATVSASRTTLPAVIFQSELDTLVPTDLQQEVLDAYAGPKRIVSLMGLGHADVADESHQDDIHDAIDWLWRQTVSPVEAIKT